MLEYSLNGNILTVKETVFSYTMTQVRYWNYDIKNWLKNANGQENEVPTIEMDKGAIGWVIKHYFPKVGLTRGKQE